MEDYLGMAANQSEMARKAMEKGAFDTAWGHYQKTSQLYMQHANSSNFTIRETLALIGKVHIAMARLLRAENRHIDALPHILYACATNNKRTAEQELTFYRPFFNRCKFQDLKVDDATNLLSIWKESPDYNRIQETVRNWANR